MRDERLGRADAGERGVEPGSAGEQLAHGDEAHRVIRVAEPVGERRPRTGELATTRQAVASSAQASGVPARRSSEGSHGSRTCCETSTDIAAAPKANGAVTLRDAP